MLVVEGGLSSVSFDTLVSSPAEQARYLADSVFNAKPALAVWDSTFHRSYAP